MQNTTTTVLAAAVIVCSVTVSHAAKAFVTDQLIRGYRNSVANPHSDRNPLVPVLRLHGLDLEDGITSPDLVQEALAANNPFVPIIGEIRSPDSMSADELFHAAHTINITLHGPFGQALLLGNTRENSGNFDYSIRLRTALAEYKRALPPEKQEELKNAARKLVAALGEVHPLEPPAEFEETYYTVTILPHLIQSWLSDKKFIPIIEVSRPRVTHLAAGFELFANHLDPSELKGGLPVIHSVLRNGSSSPGLGSIPYTVQAAAELTVERAGNSMSDPRTDPREYKILAEKLHVLLLLANTVGRELYDCLKPLNSIIIKRLPPVLREDFIPGDIKIIDRNLLNLPAAVPPSDADRVFVSDPRWSHLTAVSYTVIENMLGFANIAWWHVFTTVAGIPLTVSPGDDVEKVKSTVPALERSYDEMARLTEDAARIVGMDETYPILQSLHVKLGDYHVAARSVPLATAALDMSSVLIIDQIKSQRHFMAVIDPTTRVEEIARAIRKSFPDREGISILIMQGKHSLGSDQILYAALKELGIADGIKFIQPDPKQIRQDGPAVGINQGHLFYPMVYSGMSTTSLR